MVDSILFAWLQGLRSGKLSFLVSSRLRKVTWAWEL